ncbi:nitrate reductase subunit alpha [Acidiphilium sp.]|uniref:nitrate reductase subunit alpha n=1 Tax=Acidiphilium sp. TaxID=527 RepID=UPI003D06BD90
MSYFLDRMTFFRRKPETFADGHGITTREDRTWEDAYRGRWQHDKIVRSTHGVNCTGSCSWKIYVKGGIVTWETQQTDYPRTRPDMPNHEPRGCQRGASYSWYLYSGNRLKHPMVRGRLIRRWRAARQNLPPVAAWASIMDDEVARRDFQLVRGKGGFVRVTWDEANELIAAANAYTIRRYGPDRIFGFSPIPAMSMVSYAAGSRYLSLIGGVNLSFYDWYCDLPPASPQTWGEQTDVPESADWFNAGYVILWGSNVPQTRTPDAHFYTESRYRGTKSVVVSPDYSEASKFADLWLHPKQGTDAALGLALGHVVLREFHIDNADPYFTDYCRRYSDLPFLVRLVRQGAHLVPERLLRASDVVGALGEANNPEWKTLAFDERTGHLVAPHGTLGFRWGEDGRWNLEEKSSDGTNVRLALSAAGAADGFEEVAFPYFGSSRNAHVSGTDHQDVLARRLPIRRIAGVEGEMLVTTVFDLLAANYGLDRGFGGTNVATSYDDDVPYTPAWQENITGVPRDRVIEVARGFAENAAKTHGKSMVILGAGLNHWYHMDMSYRAIINLLVLCGCVGQSGGGWSHYVGQEKLRPQTGWLPLAFALDWQRPARQMAGTSFFYAHTDQWRYETLEISDLLSPTAPEGDWSGALMDYNLRAERLGWLPSAPQLRANPLDLAAAAEATGQPVPDYVAGQLASGDLQFASQDLDHPDNWPRNLFVWRSNLLGASGKGHEYFLKHLLGTSHGVQGKDIGTRGSGTKPRDIIWHNKAPEGKLDLLITLDFRMSTTALHSDIVLPTATWYEKNDLNTSDMHPFIHPLSAAVDPAWESRSDWDIYKGIAEAFSRIAPEVLGRERDVVLAPMMHDTPGELAQPFGVSDWTRGDGRPVPGLTMPEVSLVERDYPNVYRAFTSLGPLLDKFGNGGKGLNWNTQEEVDSLGHLNGTVSEGMAAGRPRIETDIDAAETIMMLAPETNGAVAVKAWEALTVHTGREHVHLANAREDEKIRFRDIQAQPRKIISSPIWSGVESEHVSYNAGYTNVHELIPWRTLTGRQQIYQDHLWMRAFGEGLCVWRPPIDTRSISPMIEERNANGKDLVLNFITPHQKWGIHSTYTDNLLMLTLNRGGPVVWISEIDAKTVGIVDNDWIEAYNANGALVARAVVSQRVPEGMTLMYHAQEKTVNTPGSKLTGQRGGIHNSVTRTVLKPTHMIGGYGQLAYGFNYYGPVGSNRDEFVIVRKLDEVDWLDQPLEVARRETVS